MRPLTREPTITQMISIIGGVYDDGVVGQALCLKNLDEAPDGVVNSAYHP